MGVGCRVKGVGFRQRNEQNDVHESKFGFKKEFGGSGFRKNAHLRKRSAYVRKGNAYIRS